MRKNPTYMALLGPTRLLISEKFGTYTIKWSYTIIWQVRVCSIDFETKLKIDTLKILNGFVPYYIAIHLNNRSKDFTNM